MREQRNISTQSGFSFAEMIVVLALLAIIAAITLAEYNSFSDSTVTSNLASDIGLSIRLAQSYGINVRRSGATFNVSYGIHFDRTKQDTYFLYEDPDRAADQFKYSPGDEIRTYTLSSGFRITDVCAYPTGGLPKKCFSLNTIATFDIAFDRPDPDAHFVSNLAETYERAEITIRSPRGITKTIYVLPTGYISVQ